MPLLDPQILASGDGEVRARLAVHAGLLQPLGLVHGGVYAALADLLTASDGSRAITNQTSFLRPITSGAVHALARRRHAGRTTEVWEVDCRDDQERLCAIVRVTRVLAQATRR